jgi:hypothetical protein
VCTVVTGGLGTAGNILSLIVLCKRYNSEQAEAGRQRKKRKEARERLRKDRGGRMWRRKEAKNRFQQNGLGRRKGKKRERKQRNGQEKKGNEKKRK